MNNKEKFANLYREFESETKKKLNYKYDDMKSCIDELKECKTNPYIRDYAFIEICRRLRNVYTHNEQNDYYLITDETINKFESIVEEIKNHPTVYSKATKPVYSKKINDEVLDTMNDMVKNSYTHVPIYSEDGNTLIGIFSENSIFNYILDDKIIEIDENTVFKDIQKIIDINKSKGIVDFVARDKSFDEVINEFAQEYKNGNKLECLMVTQSGKSNEKVIGIVTTWDLIGE